ncbi:Tyrosine recombinase XerD [subsurface metagenome]
MFKSLAKSRTPLSKLVADYLNYLRSTGCVADNTILGYGGSLIEFNRFCERQRITRPRQVKPQIIFAYFDILRKQGKARSTIRRVFESIKALVKFAVVNGIESRYFPQILCIRCPKVNVKLPRVLTIEQVETLLESPVPESPTYYRDRAILELLYATGIRVSELAGLKVSDVDLDGGFIIVNGKGSKERITPMITSAAVWIQEYIDSERRAQVFVNDKSENCLFLSRTGRPLYRKEVWRIVSTHAKRIGLSNVSPHTLRHCVATHLHMAGVDLRSIQELLGHASISTTQIYTHLDYSQIKKTIEKYHPRA